MANLQVTTELSGNSWAITAQLSPSSPLPAEIFIYENTGTSKLGKYVGVCNLSELIRLKVWTGEAIPKFGNQFVRYGQAKINLSLDTDPQTVVTNMVNTTKVLKAEYQAKASATTVYPI